MRKSFTRLFKVFMLLCMLSLQVVAQGATFSYTLSPTDGSCAASRTGDFVIDFNRNVYPNGLGVFALSNQFGTEYMTVQVPAVPGTAMEFFSPDGKMSVLFNADKVYIKLHDYTLNAYTPYYITVSEDAVKDGSGTFFDGLEDHNAAALTACVNNVPDWDFTTMRAGDLAVTWFNPKDEEDNVSTAQGGPLAPPAETFEVKFNRPVYWAETGLQGSALAAYPNGWLKDGYFALYKATDGFVGEYGGDVVAHILESVSITGDLLSFTFSDGYALEPNAEYYLRVRTDIIEDQYGNPWDGVNTNYEWNWRTKDGVAAKVKNIAWTANGSCSQPKNLQPFVITFDDGSTVMTTSSLKVGNNVTVTTSSIKPFITFNGSPIPSDWSVAFSTSGGDLLVTVTPHSSDPYASNTTYSIGVLAGLLDEGGDPIAAYSKNLTAGDYTPPVSSTVTANADGTTFDILGRLNEAGTIYYIVVTKASTTDGSTEDYWKPTVNELYNAIGQPSYLATRGTSTTSDDHTVTVFASGQIVIGDPSLTYHERVTGLPQSHGTYYEVYYLAFDDACESSNSVSAASAHATNNATGVLEVEESTLDILPPYVDSWKADLVKDPVFGSGTFTTPAMPNCSTGTGGTTMARMGAIYVKMNEAVERAAGYGQAITTGSQVEAIFTVEDGGTIVGLNASQCSYDAATKTFKLVPDSAFKSGSIVTVTINPNTIQDAADDPNFGPNGTELLGSPWEEFCVENYIGPVAICDDPDDDGLTLWQPADAETMVPNDESIVLAYDQQLFAPVEDESPAGSLTTISNTPGSSTFIGRYIRIR
ncbi:MAG: Ig-like domain-containing protein, partial [Prolixibacteraceae bacterium]|nr:Ig-like domain-containing protein [Prolixibacteraceae bacterium]